MGFWVFMLFVDLLIPFTMIGLGRYFFKKPPRHINPVFGYRTAMSMKNEDTWRFAHHYFGKLWFQVGLILLPVTVIAALFTIGKTEMDIGTTGGIISGIQILLILGSMFPVERALRKTFDKNGNRR